MVVYRKVALHVTAFLTFSDSSLHHLTLTEPETFLSRGSPISLPLRSYRFWVLPSEHKANAYFHRLKIDNVTCVSIQHFLSFLYLRGSGLKPCRTLLVGLWVQHKARNIRMDTRAYARTGKLTIIDMA